MDYTCECGRRGVHPYPIYGAWAMACHTCRNVSIEDRHTTIHDWREWAREAFGELNIADRIRDRIQDRLAHQQWLGELATAAWRAGIVSAGVRPYPE